MELMLLQKHLTPSLSKKMYKHQNNDGTFTLYPSTAHKLEKLLAENHIAEFAAKEEEAVVKEITQKPTVLVNLTFAILALLVVIVVFYCCIKVI